MQIFKDHIEEVKAFVPEDKLLVFDVKEGWEPLCKFLDVPVPDGKPFPRVNDSEEFKKRMQGRRFFYRAAAVAVPILIVAGAATSYWLYTKYC